MFQLAMAINMPLRRVDNLSVKITKYSVKMAIYKKTTFISLVNLLKPKLYLC